MKRKLFAIMAALVCTALTLGAKNASEYRIYINPGHGSWTADDRPMEVIHEVNGSPKVIAVNCGARNKDYTPDTIGFYESNTNLQKGFGMLEELIAAGFSFDRAKGARDLTNNLVMSRVVSGPYPHVADNRYLYNRDLTEVAAEVENNNFDLFLSIHSDAATEGSTTNLALAIYRGHDTPTAETGCTKAFQTTSKAIMTAVYNQAITNTAMNFSGTSTRVRGDFDFYGSSSTNSLGYKGYLGVLKHGTVGGLIEGYCHTYQPGRHRAMNWDVDHIEGILYARAVCDYYGLAKSGKGAIYGIIRDKAQQFSHDYYKPSSSSTDIYKAINGAQVTLKKNNAIVATYTTDNFYNGAFVFKNLNPGAYIIEVEKEGYALYSATVNVTADNNAYPMVYLGDEETVPDIDYGTFPDPAADAGIPAPESFEFEQPYTDLQIAELSGYKPKRVIADGNYLYILAHSTSDNSAKVIVFDHNNHTTVRTLGTSNCTGSVPLSDIALTGDKYLIGMNQETVALSSPTTSGRIYKWAKDSNGLPKGEATVWLTTQKQGNWTNGIIGESFTYIGNTDKGKLVYPAQSASATGIRMVTLDITDGIVNGTASRYDLLNSTSGYTKSDFGDILLFPSPFAADRFIINGSAKAGVELGMVTTDRDNPVVHSSFNTSDVNKKVNHTGIFAFGGNYYTFVHTFVSGVDATKNTRLVKLGTSLADTSRPTTTNTSEPQLETSLGICTTGTTVVDYAKDGSTVLGARMALFLLRGDKLTKIHQAKPDYNEPEDPQDPDPQDPEEPQTPDPEDPEYDGNLHYTEYAYDLSATETERNTYSISYRCTGTDAIAATLVLTPANGQGLVERIELPAPQKGLNSATISTEGFDDTAYTWAVEIKSKSNENGGMIFAESTADTPVGVRGGVVNIMDPAQASFGYTAVTYAMAGGIDVYNPERERIAVKAHKNDPNLSSTNAGSMFRGDDLEGKAVFSDYSDGSGGYWIFDPLNPEADLVQMLQGTRESTGLVSYNGTAIGGSNTCVAFTGKGTNNLKLYSFVEDYPTGNASRGNQRVRVYNLGANRTITTPPTTIGPSNLNDNSRLYNQMVNIVPTDKGIFVSQCRGAGSNSTGTPCLMFIDYNDNETFNSGKVGDVDILPNGCASGVALNKEGNILAVKGYASDIYVFDLAWEGTTPILTQKYVISTTSDSYCDHMHFDYAGNLHVVNGQRNDGISANYKIYVLPSIKPVVSTPGMGLLSSLGQDPEQPEEPDVDDGQIHAVEYAYGLSSQKLGTNQYKIKFSSTGNAPMATLVLTPVSRAGEITPTIELGAVDKGENEFTVSIDDVPQSSYNWSVNIRSTSNYHEGVVFQHDDANHTNARGGVVVITDPTKESFGYAVVGYGKAGGFDVFAPDHTQVAFRALQGNPAFSATNQSSPFRGDQLEGKAVFGDWSYSNSGLWMVDPLDMTTVENLYTGTLNTSTGIYTNNGTVLGGGVTGLAFVNQNTNNLQLYAFCEDYPSKGANNLVRYDMGASRSIVEAPAYTFPSKTNGLMGNGMVDVIDTGRGLILSQRRGAGSNSADTPCFAFTDYLGNVKFNSASINDLLPYGSSSGAALSLDGKTLAIGNNGTGIRVFNVAWDANDVPTLTLRTTLATDNNCQYSHMRFDYGGNLHVMEGENNNIAGSYKVYALANTKPVVQTPAPVNYVLEAGLTGVDDITLGQGSDDTPASYYNLGGIFVGTDAARLTPGIYIKVQGGKSEKVYIK